MSFWLKAVNLIVCVGLIFGYNAVINIRAQDENINELNAKVDSLQAQVDYDKKLVQSYNSSVNPDTENDTNSDLSGPSVYNNGEYEGTAKGYGGDITVKVTLENDTITDIQVVSAEKEDQAYLTVATSILERIKSANTADVDTVGGATFSSTGIKNAAIQALNKALI
ncbi:MAG: FMN-binding protein [Ruminococcus sp.]|nr:FMN-binding protein [Ruminococcus sp.]